MTQNAEIIADDNGIELLIGYSYEPSESTLEELNGHYHVGALLYTELNSVEIVIAGRGIEILDRLTAKQKEEIVSKLNYD